MDIQLHGRKGKNCLFLAYLYRGWNVFQIEGDCYGKSFTKTLKIQKKSNFRAIVEGIARLVIIVFAFKAFVFQQAIIPSQAMMNTLLPRDMVVISKVAYFNDSPSRGDIIAFNFPLDTTRDFIKRIIATPGDTIKIINNKVYLNHEIINESYALYDYYTPLDKYGQILDLSMRLFSDSSTVFLKENVYMVSFSSELCSANKYFTKKLNSAIGDKIFIRDFKIDENLCSISILGLPGQKVEEVVGGVQTAAGHHLKGDYRFLQLIQMQSPSFQTAYNMIEMTIPEGKYFVMGDRRDNSQDSRFWGVIDRADIVGKVQFIRSLVNGYQITKNLKQSSK